MQRSVILTRIYDSAGKCHMRGIVILTSIYDGPGKCPMRGSDLSYKYAGKCHAGKSTRTKVSHREVPSHPWWCDGTSPHVTS